MPSLLCLSLLIYFPILLTAHQWTIEQIRTLKFPHSSQGHDNGLAICKAPGFMNDVALTDHDVHLLSRANRSRLHNHHRNVRHRSTDTNRGRRAATARVERIWPHGVIPYEIQANFSGEHKALFHKAMRHWENYTCISFVQRGPDDDNYILFTIADCGCCSFVGKRGDGPQAISIGKNCDKFGIVVHELGHVVGFWHEHTRPDRDQFVDIYYKSIQQGQDYNFEKLKEDDVHSLDEAYDYASIMHYARDTFARAMYVDTILPKPRKGSYRPEIGQRIRLSEGDIRQANKLYKCPACGRTLMAPNGHLSLAKDDIVDNHSLLIDCHWRIIANYGVRIQLNITDLSLPTSTNDCSFEQDNYLIIRDGHYVGSAILGKLCGQLSTTKVYMSSGHRMLIELRAVRSRRTLPPNISDPIVTSPHLPIASIIRMSASYQVVCGGELTSDSGILQSPGYPENYAGDANCIWYVTVSDGFQVALQFDLFSLEPHNDCIYDRLEIYEGHDPDESKLIARLCGQTMPENLKTNNSNQMRLRFVSDHSVHKSGFSLQFVKEFDECKTDTHGCEHKCVNMLGTYKCECNIGYELNSDGKTCEDTCGGYIRAENGSIYSPNFPLNYPSNKRCVWEIEANVGYQITLNFTHLDVEGMKTSCEYDFVNVTSIGSSNSGNDEIVGGKYCGDYHDALVVTSISNRLRIEFVSDNSVEKTGFAAYFLTDLDECKKNKGGCQHECINLIGSYKCECDTGFVLAEDGHNCKEGGCTFQLKEPQGQISSPNYPHDYPKGKTCAWHFVTTPGHRLSLDFHEFVLEDHATCRYDKVQLFDGNSESAPSLGVYCGSAVPAPIVSTDNQLYMLFNTDASVARRGFTATYSSGAVFITFENYKLTEYQMNQRRSSGEQLCVAGSFDTQLPPIIVSSGSSLLVEMQTDDSVEQKGFVAEYRLSEPGSAPPATVLPSIRPSREPVINNRD